MTRSRALIIVFGILILAISLENLINISGISPLLAVSAVIAFIWAVFEKEGIFLSIIMILIVELFEGIHFGYLLLPLFFSIGFMILWKRIFSNFSSVLVSISGIIVCLFVFIMVVNLTFSLFEGVEYFDLVWGILYPFLASFPFAILFWLLFGRYRNFINTEKFVEL